MHTGGCCDCLNDSNTPSHLHWIHGTEHSKVTPEVFLIFEFEGVIVVTLVAVCEFLGVFFYAQKATVLSFLILGESKRGCSNEGN